MASISSILIWQIFICSILFLYLKIQNDINANTNPGSIKNTYGIVFWVVPFSFVNPRKFNVVTGCASGWVTISSDTGLITSMLLKSKK